MEQQELFDRISQHLPPQLKELLTNDIDKEDALAILVYLRSQRETLSTYLPRYLVARLADKDAAGQGASSFRLGAVMLADVAGFTALSEELTAMGKEGAEQITVIVNDFFDTMLQISGERGGDLLKFSGDALLVFFEGERGPRRAVFTAMAMQRAMGRFEQIEVAQADFSLRLSIGIGYGPLFMANLGVGEHMEYAVMGRGLANMAKAEEQASAGQIIVDQATRDAVLDVAAFTQAVDGYWLLDIVLQDETADLLDQSLNEVTAIETLLPYLSDELYSRLMADPLRSSVPGSHRPVTVLFANFFGIDEIIEALGPKHEAEIVTILNIHFETMQRILARYGGSINKVDTYAVGHRIVALFGAPQAHEDDPVRAVHAALEMNQALAQVNRQARDVLATVTDVDIDLTVTPLKQRIGINTGFVFAGNVGSTARREYSVMGDQVNLAARLMGVAREGEVLISHSTARHARERFSLKEEPPIRVKGKSHPVRRFAVFGVSESTLKSVYATSSRFVGRDGELAIGQVAVERACAQDGSVLFISGVSGIGKTRLTQEIVAYGVGAGMHVLAGACMSYGEPLPHRPWAEILRAYFGIQPGDSAAAIALEVEQVLAPLGASDWAPVIGDLIGLEMPENELTEGLDGEFRRLRTLDLILVLLQAAAREQPLLIVIEDAQWADPTSIDLINYVASNVVGQSILFILTYRLETVPPVWSNYAHAIRMPLSELSDEACLAIAQGMIGASSLSHGLAEFILTRGDGNPLFIEHIVRALMDAGILKPGLSGDWQAEQHLEAVALPDTIHGIILSRIDRLSETDRQVLQVASILGREFSLPVLKSVFRFDDVDQTVKQRLDYLCDLGLIEVQSKETVRYRFIHRTTWDVVYDSQSFERRRDLHRQIGGVLEGHYAPNLSEWTSLLAYHYWEGQDWAKATEFNLLAGRRSQREFAYGTAVTAYRRVLEAAPKAQTDTSVTRLLAHESVGEVLALLGDYEEALEHLDAARELLASDLLSDDQRYHLADLCRKTADVHERRGEYERALDWIDHGFRYLDANDPTIEMVRILLKGISIYRRQGKSDAAVDWCLKSLDVASRVRTREAQQAVAQVYYQLSSIFYARGDLDQAVEFSARSVNLYQEIDDPVGLSQAYIDMAAVYFEQGNWDDASDVLQKSLAIKRKIGDILHQGYIANELGNIYLYRGQWNEAAELLEQSRAIWQRLRAPVPQAVTLSNLAQVRIYKEDWTEASVCLSRSQSILNEIGSEEYLASLERRWAELCLKTNDLDQALERAERSVELGKAQKVRLEEGMSWRMLGLVHLARCETDKAEAALQQSLRILSDLKSHYQVARTLLALTRLQLATELKVSAEQQIRVAIETFESLGAKADLAAALAIEQQLSSTAAQDS